MPSHPRNRVYSQHEVFNLVSCAEHDSAHLIGTAAHHSCRGEMPYVRIEIDEKDIATIRGVDAIVNAAHRPDLDGGRVSSSIWRHAGPMLARDPSLLGGCRIGEVKLTPGYKLHVPWIIHTQRPHWQGGGHGEFDRLRHCYRNAFALAQNHCLHSLAFPVMGSGSTGYPFQRAALVALEEAGLALAANLSLQSVVFCISDARGYDPTLMCIDLFGD